ncbi:MAG: hypothetical protein Q4D42_10635 [Eubacteriales bacterium]|nr:hypothetical protein [Eubacteriales bacterium]
MAKTKYEQNKKYAQKYLNGLDSVQFRIPKGEKDVWKEAARAHGKSLTQYLLDLVHADNPDLFPEKEVSSGDK